MNILCVICTELLISSDDEVVHTPCGHIFHTRCLKQWLERSETCPQCRQGTTKDMMNKIYFSFSDNDNLETFTSLQNKNNDLTLKLRLRDRDINNLTEMRDKLVTQTADLKHEISCKDVTINELKDQIKFWRQQCQNMEINMKKIEEIKIATEKLRILQAFLDENFHKRHMDEADNKIVVNSDIDESLANIAVIKKNMIANFEEKNKMKAGIKELYLQSINLYNAAFNTSS